MNRLNWIFVGLLLAVRPAVAASAPETNGNPFVDTVVSNFSAWDTNHDQRLSRPELDAAIEDPTNKGPAAAALAALKRGNVPRPWTVEKLRQASDTNKSNLLPLYRQFLRRINGATNRDLYASGLPKLTTIHQGRMGNCYTLGPLGAMLYRNPRDIATLFTVQPDGHVLVRFAGGAVTVAPLTDAEIALTAGNSRDGVWIGLYEKAMGEARNERMPPNKQFKLPIDAIATGGLPEPIMSYLTGHKVGGISIQFGETPDAAAQMKQLRRELTEATREKRLMGCDTRETTTPGLTPLHSYALLEYDAAADTVKLWNPHGDNFKPKGPAGLTNGYPRTNGIFTMPLADLPKQFYHVSIERAEPATLQWLDEWELLAQSSRFKEAAADLSEIIDLDPSAHSEYLLTPLLIQSGRIHEYRSHCKAMLDRFEKTMIPAVAENTAKSCLLLPSAMSARDTKRAADLAARGVTLSKKGDWTHWRLMTRALAEYRERRYQAALETAPLSRKDPTIDHDLNGDSCKADTYFIAAMAHEKLKESNQARADLDRALEIVRKRLPKLDGGDLGYRWFDTLMANILMREAVATVEGSHGQGKTGHTP